MSASGTISFRAEVAVVVALLAIHATLAVTSFLQESATYDEIVHVTDGYAALKYRDFRLAESNQLPQQLMALPLLGGDRPFPPFESPMWKNADAYLLGYGFFYKVGNDARDIQLRGRLVVLGMSLALALLVHQLARRWFGPVAGLLALALYTLDPNILAHARLMTADIPLSLALLAGVIAVWWTMQQPSLKRMLVSAVVVTALLLTKSSGLLIVPITALLAIVRLVAAEDRRQMAGKLALAFAVHIVVAVVIVWAFYGFRYSAFAEEAGGPGRFYKTWEETLPRTGRLQPVLSFARDHQLLPEGYLYSVAHVAAESAKRRAFLNGEYSVIGWPQFFPYTLLVKTPLPLFVILGLAIAAWARGPTWRSVYRTAPLWALLLVYWVVAVRANLNIGHRHILPTYAPMFILAAGAAAWFTTSIRWPRYVLMAAMLLIAIDTARIHPHYLAYFNPIAGGPSGGYHHLVDSSLDWGQDLPGLKRYLDENNLNGEPGERVYLCYFGSADREYHGIRVTDLPGYWHLHQSRVPEPLQEGVYCISVTMLQSLYGPAVGPWTRDYEAAYQAAQNDARRYSLAQSDPAALAALLAEHDQAWWTKRCDWFEQLRVDRVCSFLRHWDRQGTVKPIHQVGYSINIYRLTPEEITAAQFGPPVELVERMQVRGAP